MAAITAAYGALAAAYLLLFGYNTSWIGAIVKMLPILLLAAASARQMRGAWRRGMVTALLFSALGDWLLGMNGVLGNLFTAGLGSFLVAQLAYAQLFWRHRTPDRRRRWLAACYLPVAAALAWLVLPAAGEMAVPVARVHARDHRDGHRRRARGPPADGSWPARWPSRFPTARSRSTSSSSRCRRPGS